MKTADIVLLLTAAAVLGGVLYATRKKIVPNPNINTSATYNGTKSVPLADGAANGWQYFTDGTSIGPDGKYYYQGVQVYDPAGMYQGMPS